MGKSRRKAIALNLAKAKLEMSRRGDRRPKATGAKPKGKREPRRAEKKGEGRNNKVEQENEGEEYPPFTNLCRNWFHLVPNYFLFDFYGFYNSEIGSLFIFSSEYSNKIYNPF
jgi:hypothetical protein